MSTIRRRPRLRIALVAAALAACSSPDEEARESDALLPTDSIDSIDRVDTETSERPCAPVPGRPSPNTVLAVIDRVNELPRPVTLPCFLDSLARPLELNATESLISAQPAVGRRSPRMFIFVDPLILSISFDGVGSRLLEMGELRPDGLHALRAEIEFPVDGELAREAPFERILFLDRLTTCGGCHAGERPAPDVTFTKAFESHAIRPLERERVPLEALATERADCDAAREPERCAMLEAVFTFGDVVERDFPATLPTFY